MSRRARSRDRASGADGDLPVALVEFAGVRRDVCVACVPEVVPGNDVIVLAGIAISRVDAEKAGPRLGEAGRASIAMLESGIACFGAEGFVKETRHG